MEIKDVIHFYIGQNVFESFNNRVCKLIGVDTDKDLPVLTLWEGKGRWTFSYDEVKPILRKLSDMTEEEGIKLVGHQSSVYTQVEKVASSNHCFRFSFEYTSSRRRREWTIDYNRLNPEQFHYLLKQGFDLFGLIDAGLAIDNKSI